MVEDYEGRQKYYEKVTKYVKDSGITWDEFEFNYKGLWLEVDKPVFKKKKLPAYSIEDSLEMVMNANHLNPLYVPSASLSERIKTALSDDAITKLNQKAENSYDECCNKIRELNYTNQIRFITQMLDVDQCIDDTFYVAFLHFMRHLYADQFFKPVYADSKERAIIIYDNYLYDQMAGAIKDPIFPIAVFASSEKGKNYEEFIKEGLSHLIVRIEDAGSEDEKTVYREFGREKIEKIIIRQMDLTIQRRLTFVGTFVKGLPRAPEGARYNIKGMETASGEYGSHYMFSDNAKMELKRDIAAIIEQVVSTRGLNKENSADYNIENIDFSKSDFCVVDYTPAGRVPKYHFSSHIVSMDKYEEEVETQIDGEWVKKVDYTPVWDLIINYDNEQQIDSVRFTKYFEDGRSYVVKIQKDGNSLQVVDEYYIESSDDEWFDDYEDE
ncbi:hypothetical protein [Butyrivibrio sp. MC2021]|uniref:hypothetical protein n=1 Tax=Butyrivibrio sp. MC2021 TaxID=1408306 RepID=UPI000478F682|nr:hypothetical protein [Butyrivibrio sp. MC2021]